MKLSKKKESELWKVINDAVVDARIEIARLEPGNKTLEKVDHILYRLGIDCPEKAIKIFKKGS